MVRLDRGLGSSAARAKISISGSLYTYVTAGTPVSIKIRRGIIEVLSVEATFNQDPSSVILKGIQLTRSSNLSCTSSTDTTVAFGTIVQNDLGINQIATPVAISGTVSKTASGFTITGSSTTFMDDLEVGDLISIPGGATEYFAVVAIASQTSLTVGKAAANSSSGQTLTKTNAGIVVPFTGWWDIGALIQWEANASSTRTMSINVNGVTRARDRETPSSVAITQDLNHKFYLSQYDLVQLVVNPGSVTVLIEFQTYSPIFTLATAII
jgi:hypothetical protein